uniref:Uncharacterized protein n=1 Tax=Arundo donax TaxID=35708 RepID=A0A0A9DDP2_ARUDO
MLQQFNDQSKYVILGSLYAGLSRCYFHRNQRMVNSVCCNACSFWFL